MITVRFDAGVEILNEQLNAMPNLAHIFRAVTARHTSDTQGDRLPGHSVVFPSHIDVTLFTDMDNNFGYAINTSKELDSGRMNVSDFVIRQSWTEVNGENRLELLNESGEGLVQLDKTTTLGLSLVADTYRFAHSETFRQ